MRRSVYIFFLCVFLGACGRSADLPPHEVLKRTARASQELSSARFFLLAIPRWEYGATAGELTFNIDGRLQHGGDQIQFLASVQGDIRGPGGETTSLTSAFEVIVSGPEELYLNVHTLESQPPLLAFQSLSLAELVGKWLQLSAPVSAISASSSMAPDPHLLKMQSEIVDIVRDRGQEMHSGRSRYHYDVRLNTEKLLTFVEEVSRVREESLDTTMLKTFLAFVNAEGELFIDAETFLIERLVWHISAPHVPFGAFSLDLTLDLKDHGKAPPILPPLDATPFPSAALIPVNMGALSTGDLLPELTPSIEEEIQSVMMDTEP
ncbi:hypothetical protein HYZ98_00195 [Candidatus Peregrinibacteria bacterium]|nr:hypothetical protein [Candidatus Peregrinibacteria bacterium]